LDVLFNQGFSCPAKDAEDSSITKIGIYRFEIVNSPNNLVAMVSAIYIRFRSHPR
jgi:hypothetical protein